jgi:hypothetical protein
MNDRPFSFNNYLQASSDGATILTWLIWPVAVLATTGLLFILAKHYKELQFTTEDLIICSIIVIPIISFAFGVLCLNRLAIGVPVIVLIYMSSYPDFDTLANILRIGTDIVGWVFTYTLYPFWHWIISITNFDVDKWLNAARATH